MASSTINLKASGLKVSPNQLSTDPGSLQEAVNVVIQRDNVIQPRRGYKLYGTSMGSASDRAKQLIFYKTRLLRHYSNILQFENGQISDDGETEFSSFSGTYEEPNPGIRIKSIESNGNLYFTTSEGVKKISASTPSQFTTANGYVVDAGGIKAVDQTAVLDITLGSSSGFLPADSAVAYRVVWGYKDNNQNLILGTPSQRSVVYNPLQDLINMDLMNVLQGIDNVVSVGGGTLDGSPAPANGTYINTFKVSLMSTAAEALTQMVALSAQLDADIGGNQFSSLALPGMQDVIIASDSGTNSLMTISNASITTGTATINFSSGIASDNFTVGQTVTLSGFTTTTGNLNGNQVVGSIGNNFITFTTTATGTVTIIGTQISASEVPAGYPDTPATNDQLVAIQNYLLNIIEVLQSQDVSVIPTQSMTDFIDPLDITTSANVRLTITIPQGITPNYFFQIYRSPIAQATGTQVLATDVVPSDELQQVYEAFPTNQELLNGEVTVIDSVPDSFRGAFLYTNESTGEGILQGNELPPFALDINRFKNVLFYANTRTRQAINLNLLGVQKMIVDYNNSIIPTVTIANSTTSNTYSFIKGIAEIRTITTDTFANTTDSGYFTLYSANDTLSYYVWMDKTGTSTDPAPVGFDSGIRVIIENLTTAEQIADQIRDIINVYISDFIATTSGSNVVTINNINEGSTVDSEIVALGGIWASSTTQQGQGEEAKQETSDFTTVADVAGSLAGRYFGITSAFNLNRYYVWFRVSGSGSDPLVANRTGIRIDLTTGDTANNVALKIATQINTQLPDKFQCSNLSDVLTVKTLSSGPAEDSIIGTSTFTLNISQQGSLNVLLSSNVSPSVALDESTRSFVRVINKNLGEILYAYYISGPSDVPGKMFLQERVLSTDLFYVVANNSSTGTSFNPDISPTVQISSIAVGTSSTMIVTTSTNHGLTNLDKIVITNSDSINGIDGEWQVTVLSPTTFRIPQNISTAGTKGALITTIAAEGVSTNEDRKNRIYYSKVNQPEAVPLLNYFDVGAQDKAILRIFPLRDTLFVFKEDGLFRISGEAAPFVLSLFDGSCILIAPDSIGLLNNILYFWTRYGINACSEAGVSNPPLSRDIDTLIIPTPVKNLASFTTSTFGLGYESDNSYIVWTIDNSEDEVATIAYRYCNLTNTWTNYDKSNTCGLVNPITNKMYLGAGDTNFLEEERKNFLRTDFADREFTNTLGDNKYFGNSLLLSNINNITVGDVIVQDQTLTIFEYNALLEKLDLDPSVGKVLISNISTGSTTVTIVTQSNHTLVTGDYVDIAGTDSFPTINNQYQVTVINSTTFTIVPGYTLTSSGAMGSVKYSYIKNQVSIAGDNMRNVLITLTERLDIDPGLNYTGYENDIASKSGSITGIQVGLPSQVTTSTSHGLFTGRVLIISGTNSSPTIDGTKEIIVTGSNTFSVPVSVITPGTTGSYATATTNFQDLKACYNKVISDLNADVGASFSNYRPIDNNTNQESIVIAIDKNSKSITLNVALDYIVGVFTIYQHIDSNFTYSNITMGDSLNMKHISEATVMFENKAFTSAVLSFSSDLLPKYEMIPFRGDGNGIFGIGTGFFGNSYFGGSSHGAPFRTYVPRNCQRCRYLNVNFEHGIARENYAIYGITLTGNVGISNRAYR